MPTPRRRYVQTVRGRGRERIVDAPYIRSSAQIVLILSAMSIGLSLTLVALEPIWNRLLFVLLSVLFVVATSTAFDASVNSRGKWPYRCSTGSRSSRRPARCW